MQKKNSTLLLANCMYTCVFSLFLTLFSCEVNSYKFEADFGGKLFGSIYRPINLSDNSVEELNLGKDNMT